MEENENNRIIKNLPEYWIKFENRYSFYSFVLGLIIFIISVILIKNDKWSNIIAFLSMLMTVVGVIGWLNKINSIHFDNTLKSIVNNINEKFKDAKLIFETSVSAFDMPHIIKLQDYSESWLNVEEVKSIDIIYAIDYSAPIEWWNESMTAYLAILSKWINNNGKNKSVKRLFVYNQHDLHNTLCIRTLFFHIQLGFETFLIEYEKFISLFNKITTDLNLNELKNKGPRELLIWNIFDENNNLISQRLANGESGYQSFWEIDKNRESMKKIKKEYKEKGIANVHRYFDSDNDEFETKILFEGLKYYIEIDDNSDPNHDPNHVFSNEYIKEQIKLVKDGVFKKENNEYKYFKKFEDGTEAYQEKYYGIFLNFDKPDTNTIEKVINKYVNTI